MAIIQIVSKKTNKILFFVFRFPFICSCNARTLYLNFDRFRATYLFLLRFNTDVKTTKKIQVSLCTLHSTSFSISLSLLLYNLKTNAFKNQKCLKPQKQWIKIHTYILAHTYKYDNHIRIKTKSTKYEKEQKK